MSVVGDKPVLGLVGEFASYIGINFQKCECILSNVLMIVLTSPVQYDFTGRLEGHT